MRVLLRKTLHHGGQWEELCNRFRISWMGKSWMIAICLRFPIPILQPSAIPGWENQRACAGTSPGSVSASTLNETKCCPPENRAAATKANRTTKYGFVEASLSRAVRDREGMIRVKLIQYRASGAVLEEFRGPASPCFCNAPNRLTTLGYKRFKQEPRPCPQERKNTGHPQARVITPIGHMEMV